MNKMQKKDMKAGLKFISWMWGIPIIAGLILALIFAEKELFFFEWCDYISGCAMAELIVCLAAGMWGP